MVLRMLENKTQGIGSLCTEQSIMKNEATQNEKTPPSSSSSSNSNQILYDSIKQGFYEIVTCGATSGNGPCVTINNACTPIISRKTTRRGYQKMKSSITTNTNNNNNNNNEGDSPTTVASYQIERMTREWGPSHHEDEDSEKKDDNNNKANEALNTTDTTIGTSDDEDDTNSDKSVVANNKKIKTRLFESFVQSAQSAIAYDPVNSGCVSFSLYGSKNNNKAYRTQTSDPQQQADSSPSWICNAIPTPPDMTCSAFSMSLKNGKTNLQKRKERHLKRIQSLDLLPEDQEANPTQQQQNYSPNKKNQTQQASLQRASPIVSKLPPPTLIQLDDYEDFPDSISELTMKSSHGCAIASQKIHYKDRRMAYYAIGQQQHEDDKQQQDEEHNRWCYFSGLPLKQNESFYAGIIEQGMRTLVVFCLPQAISQQRIQHHYLLQQKEQLNTTNNTNDSKSCLSSVSMSVSATSIHSSTSTAKNNKSKVYPVQKTKSSKSSILSRKKKKNSNNNNNSSTTQSQSPPDLDIIDKIKLLYPDQFSTLPPLIRSQDAWKLFSKFCFFSGIPIADGELHYSLKNNNNDNENNNNNNDIYGNNILLSHEVMEAVNGEESAQILRLPNQKLFVYLKKNYNTQCEKIPSDVLFHRKNWQIVLPEI